jgi:hydroxymethylpyrimidine pyrophosphatase-like HAD family hydrolase
MTCLTCASALGTPVEIVYTDVPARASELDINSMPFHFVQDWNAADLKSTVAILLEIPRGRSNVHLAEIQKALSTSVRVTSSGGPFYELTTSDTSKGTALERMIGDIHSIGAQFKTWNRFAHITMATTMAIGDNLNDVDMLQSAGVSVAVSNSREEVKSIADYVTSLPAGRGVVEALRLLLDVKRYRSPHERD